MAEHGVCRSLYSRLVRCAAVSRLLEAPEKQWVYSQGYSEVQYGPMAMNECRNMDPHNTMCTWALILGVLPPSPSLWCFTYYNGFIWPKRAGYSLVIIQWQNVFWWAIFINKVGIKIIPFGMHYCEVGSWAPIVYWLFSWQKGKQVGGNEGWGQLFAVYIMGYITTCKYMPILRGTKVKSL